MSTVSRTCGRYLRLSRCRPTILAPPTYPIHRPQPAQFSLYVPLTSMLASSSLTRAHERRETLKAQKLEDLKVAIQRRASPSRIWGHYVDLLNFVPLADVPLDVHQSVLRWCSPPASEVRIEFAKSLLEGKRPRVSHFHEVRFQSIIHNIREAGHTPSLDDYHLILEQFAAVGHHLGSIRVLQEIFFLGLPTTPKTYGLCLQALCHRLKLPCYHDKRPELVRTTVRMCMKLLNEMWARDIPFTSVNVDLTLRVLKETMNYDLFEKLMKFAYGVDLSYPDRAPLEFWEQGRKPKALDGNILSLLSAPQPLGTAALNTTIDTLGHIGNISKLVQTFEVLTTPLPTTPSSKTPSFDEDDDDDFGFNVSVAPYSPPHAEPNTTTYALLLKWISKGGHASLARHYILQAMELDRRVDRKLRGDCLLLPEEKISAPHFAMNRLMFLSAFGEANRDKNMGLLHWILSKIRRVLGRKRADMKYYKDILNRWRPGTTIGEELGNNSRVASSKHPRFIVSSSKKASSDSPVTNQDDMMISLDHFSVDLEAPPSPPPSNFKPFDIDFHLSVLDRDHQQLEHLEKVVMDVIGRTSQRIKERLGRRVWGGRNIYLRSVGSRTSVGRSWWTDNVNFRQSRAVPTNIILPSNRRGSKRNKP